MARAPAILMRLVLRLLRATALAVAATAVLAQGADFGRPGAAPPANLDEIAGQLRREPYDLELLISYGTSKGGSAGHLALAIRDPGAADDDVYSANFYADRAPEHERDFYTGELMVRVPKMEYLYGTTSSLGEKASFGLDFGEAYKRSVVGVRVRGVPAAEKQALVAFFERINDDYRKRARRTDYHDGEISYGYLDLNCAKTIGMGFKLGAGYADLDVKHVSLLLGLRVVAAVNANIPTEMALKLMKEWHARGHAMEVVRYQKIAGSTYVDPHDDEGVAFKDLPDRRPSVLSRDFRREAGEYEDFDNLYAMYLFQNLGRLSVRANERTRLLEIDIDKTPMPFAQAVESAARSARAHGQGVRQAQPGPTRDQAAGEAAGSPPPADVAKDAAARQ
ncbi:MAG: hypothetical protein KA151_07565 [Piscinibacter sp.]|nr:hypothetical protein [Piscinibacter sp.]